VPLTVEGVPEGFVFDYNWDANLSKQDRIAKVRLPTAEVTEEGRFVIWWNRCNFYELTEQECRGFIKIAVSHEAQHYNQWLTLARRTVDILGLKIETPKNIDELRKIEGAEKVFMKMWSDGAHYQCREVEVYTRQMLTGEMPIDMPGRLKNLQNYYVGCGGSKHAEEFREFLQSAKQLFDTNEALLK
jgi:hypothetical protein